MAKLICTFEGSGRCIEYTSDNGYKGHMESNMIFVTDPAGACKFKHKVSTNATIKDLIDLTDNMPELLDDYKREHGL